MDISVSDYRLFNRCRRKWDLTSVNRQGLAKMMAEKKYFLLGSMVHALLEAQSNDPERYRYSVAIDAMVDIEHEQYANYERIVGSAMSDGEKAVYWGDLQHTAIDMVDDYVAYYGQQTLARAGLRYVSKEITFRIPIPNTDGHLRGTIDGLARSIQDGRLWIVEHKTYSRRPSEAQLLFDDQIRAYAWAILHLTGELPAGAVYDGLNKKRPLVPRLLKDGSLSTAKIDTTVATYKQAIADNGLDEADYTKTLDEIKNRLLVENPFYFRHTIPIGRAAVTEIVETVRTVYNEINRADLQLWPYRPFNGCSDCEVKQICESMTLDEDLSGILKEYVRAEPYGSFSKTPTETLIIPA